MTSKPDQFNCLNHGDAWLPNILFHNDSNGVLDDCQFIDFQQSVYTSPAVDLLSLIFTSAETETKLQNFEHYVSFYHQQLVDALKLLKYAKNIPTLKELHSDLFDRGFLGVWHSFCMLPVALVEGVKESSSDNLLGENEEGLNYKRKLYNNARYQKHMTDLLTYFNRRGLLDL
jgi:Ecdysteroid kinase-like family